MLRYLVIALLLLAACEERRMGNGMVLTPRGDASTHTSSTADASADDAATTADDAAEGTDGDLDAGFEILDASANDDAATSPPDASAPDAAMASNPDASMMLPSGCGVPQNSGVFNGAMTVGGRMRTSIVSVPANYDPSRPYALVFAWHGQNWQSDPFRMAHMDLETASNGEAIVVWPQSLMINGAFSWDLSGNGLDVQYYDAMRTYFLSNFCIDTNRVFSFGRSYGSFFTNVLGCVRRSELRGISVWAGVGPNGNCPGRLSAWVGHARDDTTVTFTTASRDHYVRANGCTVGMTVPATPAPCVTYAGCQGGTKVNWCEDQTGGHTPPFDYGTSAWRFFDSL